jgi:hypothetical protein
LVASSITRTVEEGRAAGRRLHKTTEGNRVTASEQLYKLADRAKQSEANIASAKEKGQADLQAQVSKARQSSEQRAADLKTHAAAAHGKASAWWGSVQDEWNQHITTIRQNVDDKKAGLDAKRAENRAENAEDDAEAAVDFAYAALEEAEYAVLDAELARLQADEMVSAR